MPADDTRFWKYGDIQVGFDGEVVSYAGMYLSSEPRPVSGGGKLDLLLGVIRGDLTIESLTEWLTQRACASRTVDW